MTKRSARILIAVALATGAIAVPAAGASAAAARPAFADHVVECAQTMGLSGTHNPGMHQGASGWDGMACAEHH